jgi:hypothetical protein
VWRRCTIVIMVILVLAAGGGALAQDRPLLEPLRLGYARSDPVGEALRHSVSLQAALRRRGYIPDWHVFTEGLDAVRSLDAGELDLALNIPLGDVVAAKRANLKMVFIAELRSIAPTCCELEQQFSDHILKRYTLSSEYLADSREDVLLILHQETLRVLRAPAPQMSARPGPTAVSIETGQPLLAGTLTSPITRDTMRRANEAAGRLPGIGPSSDPVNLSDVNYWAPYE